MTERQPRPVRRTKKTKGKLIHREPKTGDLVLFQANGRQEVGVFAPHGIESPSGCFRNRPILGVIVPDR